MVNGNKNADFFDTAPSYEAWETHWYLKNRLGIVCARGGGLLDHPYAPCKCGLYQYIGNILMSLPQVFLVLSFEAREVHQHYNSWLDIFRTQAVF